MKVNQFLSVVLSLCVIALVTGCMYPKERRMENQVPSTFYLEATQKAVEQFQKDTGILPIETKPADTPIFEKYEINFSKLMPKYLPDVPANSFEKGGVYKYTLIDVETKPTVRLIHLGVVSKVADAQHAVNSYIYRSGKLPTKTKLDGGYFTIDYSLIGLKEPEIPSMVNNAMLTLIMNSKGEVGVDYGPDIALYLRNAKSKVPPNTDPRYLLARESVYVPIKSFPYTIQNGDPKLLKLN